MIAFVVTLAIFVAFALGILVGALFAYVKEEETDYDQAKKHWRQIEGL